MDRKLSETIAIGLTAGVIVALAQRGILFLLMYLLFIPIFSFVSIIMAIAAEVTSSLKLSNGMYRKEIYFNDKFRSSLLLGTMVLSYYAVSLFIISVYGSPPMWSHIPDMSGALISYKGVLLAVRYYPANLTLARVTELVHSCIASNTIDGGYVELYRIVFNGDVFGVEKIKECGNIPMHRDVMGYLVYGIAMSSISALTLIILAYMYFKSTRPIKFYNNKKYHFIST